jgi:hypothetical protein
MYLRQKLAGTPWLMDGADDLASDLGYLPLALAQAAAYLLDRELTCAEYRVRFADERRRLADLVPESSALPDEYQYTIAVTWSISIELADRLRPAGLARPLLEVASLLEPNGMPLEIFAAPSLAAYLADRRGGRHGRPSRDDILDALHALHRLSLANFDRDARMIRVHSLVQRAVREATPTTRQPSSATAAADALLATWPAFDVDWSRVQASQGCAVVLRAVARRWLEPAHPVLFRAAHSIGTTGQASKAVEFLTALLELDDEAPIDAGDALALCVNLGYWSGRSEEDVDGAAHSVRICEIFADECLQALGQDDVRTLAAKNNLAHWKGRAGDVGGAIELLTRLSQEAAGTVAADPGLALTVDANLAFWRGVSAGFGNVADTLELQLRRCLQRVGSDDAIAQVICGKPRLRASPGRKPGTCGGAR